MDALDTPAARPQAGAIVRKARRVPWRDHSGRLSLLKTAVFVALFLPGLDLAWDYSQGNLGPRALNELIHGIGLWAIRLLLISFAITPLRQLLKLPQLVLVRRMIGVAAFVYVAIHFFLFVVDSSFRLGFVATEIVLRLYLTIGFVTLLMLTALAATSTDGMVRRLGGQRWRKLHWFAYPAGALALAHHVMQTKLNVAEATWMAGMFLWMMGYRLLARSGSTPGLVRLGLLTAVMALVTVAGEAAGFGLFTGIKASRVLEANIVLVGQRPGWIVLFIGIGVMALTACRPLWMRSSSSRRSRT